MLRDIKAKSAEGGFLPPKGRSGVIKFIITLRSSRNIMNYAKVLYLCDAILCKRGILQKWHRKGVITQSKLCVVSKSFCWFLTAPLPTTRQLLLPIK